jgi:signal transduction histidine kinase
LEAIENYGLKPITINRTIEDFQVLEHLLEHTQAIVWKADLEFNLMYIKGSLSSSESDTQSIEGELESVLQNSRHQLSQIEKGKPIVLDHQWNDIQVQTNIRPLFDVCQQINSIMGVTVCSTSQSDQTSAQDLEPIHVLGNFLEAASHDLRTPLSVINTSIYLLEKSKTQAKRDQHIQTLRDTLDRLQKILDSMFLMARTDSLPAYISNPIQLDSMLHNIGVNFYDKAHAKNIKLEIRQLDVLPSIYGHETELHIALSNLVKNSIQNTASDGFIQILASTDENNVIIQVIDNGKGISADDLPHIFERFYRVDKYHPTDDTRVGLGLSITKRVVEKHNGQIKIESELGKGTCILITLPVKAQL